MAKRRRAAAATVSCIALACCTAAPAGAQVLTQPGAHILIEGRSAVFFDRGRRAARIAVIGDRELGPPLDPRCPQPTRLQLAAVPHRGEQGLVHGPVVELPCENWRRVRDEYRYRDPDALAGGVRSVDYTRGRLEIRLGGDDYVAPPAPMAFAQLRFEVGDTSWIARFYAPSKNKARAVRFDPPRAVAARGERAFWDTIQGSADRTEDAARWLRKAARRSPADGRSPFLLGMLRFYEAGRSGPRWHDPDRELKRSMRRATRALARAEALLWDGKSGDARVPGFAAIAAYQLAFLRGDAEGMEESLAALNRAVDAHPIFNNFSLFGAAAMTPPGDPVYDRILEVADDLLGFGPSAQCVFSQPEICGSAGLAPHGTEAALSVLGDIYLKGGERERADQTFRLAALFGSDTGWPYLPLLAQRRAELDERLALYGNGDPTDDPPLFGQTDGACLACHVR